MSDIPVSFETGPDGSLIVEARGELGIEHAVELRRTLVHCVRHIRPLRLILDLHAVSFVDPINLGTLAAACQLGDDHQVAVFLDHPSAAIAEQLTAAGVARHRLRHVAPAGSERRLAAGSAERR